MTGYRNPAYDALADQAENTLGQEERRQLVFELQRMIGRDLPVVPLYNPLLVEGVRIDRFKGWVSMLEGVGNLWSFCQIKPANHAD
jgi:ABC-type transport system substrate-binding protein